MHPLHLICLHYDVCMRARVCVWAAHKEFVYSINKVEVLGRLILDFAQLLSQC